MITPNYKRRTDKQPLRPTVGSIYVDIVNGHSYVFDGRNWTASNTGKKIIGPNERYERAMKGI